MTRFPLPEAWSLSTPRRDDVEAMTTLLRRHEEAAKGSASTSFAVVEADVTGTNAQACTHIVARDAAGDIRGWASAHDRAAGRVLGAVTVDQSLADELADAVAAALYEWLQQTTVLIGQRRGLARNQLDSGAFAVDERQQRWLKAAGLEHVRSWWQMSRPVAPEEADCLPDPRAEVVVRSVDQGPDGMPADIDLRTIHGVLETAFADHFNNHRESFEEFVARLRTDPGHRWDHWWLAEIADEHADLDTPLEQKLPAGTLVATASPGPGGEGGASYVSYLGVLQSARGHGVAKALLNAVIADAAVRGRSAVTLEVDADSPTGADGLYLSMGFETTYTTQSWHQYFDVPPQ